jgi:hypothetical protein
VPTRIRALRATSPALYCSASACWLARAHSLVVPRPPTPLLQNSTPYAEYVPEYRCVGSSWDADCGFITQFFPIEVRAIQWLSWARSAAHAYLFPDAYKQWHELGEGRPPRALCAHHSRGASSALRLQVIVLSTTTLARFTSGPEVCARPARLGGIRVCVCLCVCKFACLHVCVCVCVEARGGAC